MSLKKFLKKTVAQTIEEYGEFSLSEWIYVFLQNEDMFVNFPKVKEQDIDNDWEDDLIVSYDETYEELDFENFEILSIDLETQNFIFCAGGDWQTPLEVSATFVYDIIEFEILSKGKYTDDDVIDEVEFLRIVYGKKWREKLIKKFNYKYD